MKTAILSVGTELLFGQITNTNTVYLSQQLNLLGFDVMYHYTVGDNPIRLKDMIELIFRDCDLIITTGGLGPTQDDLTKEIVCEAMEDVLVCHEGSLNDLKEYYKAMGRTMSHNNLKQAMMPKRAIVFDNDAGTAPGFALENKGKYIICMPGPPREMERIWNRRVKPYLEKMQDSVIFYKILRTFEIGESSLETVLLPYIDNQTDPTIATYAKEGECSLRIASKRKTIDEAKEAVDDLIEKIKPVIGQYVYSYDNEDFVDVVTKKLLSKGITISSAESCTGGLFAGRLTDVPGISDIFERSIVTYSNRAKIEELGVSPTTLEKYGAVSPETAKEMVQGLRKKTGSRLCVSVTGVAGPGGGTAEKPVGLMYIGCIFDGDITVKKIRMRNINRKWNRHYAVLSMLNIVNKIIDK
ncbi:MAG: competence/damage-inducible protein A [Eubacteriales bacterium]|nr:competence/damage-inducible protein A [Eubacteriales bacterium]